jgi:hypothetical protein
MATIRLLRRIDPEIQSLTSVFEGGRLSGRLIEIKVNYDESTKPPVPEGS